MGFPHGKRVAKPRRKNGQKSKLVFLGGKCRQLRDRSIMGKLLVRLGVNFHFEEGQIQNTFRDISVVKVLVT